MKSEQLVFIRYVTDCATYTHEICIVFNGILTVERMHLAAVREHNDDQVTNETLKLFCGVEVHSDSMFQGSDVITLDEWIKNHSLTNDVTDNQEKWGS